MRRLLCLIALIACSSAAPALALPWELRAQAGGGARLGPGWDSNQLGAALSLSGGPRFRYLAVHGGLLANEFVLRAVKRDQQVGQTLGALLSVPVYPLGGRYDVEPYLEPALGIASTVARVNDDAKVDVATRAWFLGATLGAYWVINPRYSLGGSIFGARLYVRKACIRVSGELTACGAEPPRTSLVSLLASFRVSFGAPAEWRK